MKVLLIHPSDRLEQSSHWLCDDTVDTINRSVHYFSNDQSISYQFNIKPKKNRGFPSKIFKAHRKFIHNRKAAKGTGLLKKKGQKLSISLFRLNVE